MVVARNPLCLVFGNTIKPKKAKIVVRIFMNSKSNRAYVLVVIQPGKEREFANEIVSKGWIVDSKVARMDFVHGSYDFIIILNGTTYDIDSKILELRKLPYVRRTETLIPFEMLNWDDISATLKESPEST